MGAGKRLTLHEHVRDQQKRASQKGSGRYHGKLRNWRAKENLVASSSGEKRATLYCVLAAKADMIELPLHNFPKVVTLKGEGGEDGKTTVFSEEICCFERNEIIESQYNYNDDGSRKFPPVLCPVCRLNEWVRSRIEAGKLDWLKKAMRFESQSRDLLLHTGGMIGMYTGFDISDEDKKTIRDAGVKLSEAFKEDVQAKIKFLYCLVDLSEIDKGLQATIEGKSIGGDMSAIIDERVGDLGETGDPSVNPFPWKWIYRPDSKDIRDRYSVATAAWDELPKSFGDVKARAIELAMSDKIPPVFEQLRRYPNVKKLRLAIEGSLLLDGVPLDEIFGPVEERCDENGWFKDDEDEKRGDQETSFDHGANVKGSDPPKGGDTFECGACSKDVPEDASECPHCHASFEDDEDEDEDEDEGGGSAAEHVDEVKVNRAMTKSLNDSAERIGKSAAAEARAEREANEKVPEKPAAQKAVEEARSNARRGKSTTRKNGKKNGPPKATGETPEEAAKRVLGDDDLPPEKGGDDAGDSVPWDED